MADYMLGAANLISIYLQASDEATTTLIDLVLNIDTDISYDANGQMTITPNQEMDNADLLAAFEAALPVGVSVTAEPERTYQDGTKVGGGTSSALPSYLAIVYEGLTTDGTNKRKVTVAEVQFDPTSRSRKLAANTPSSPKVILKSVLTSAEKTIAVAKFDALYAAPASDVTIPDNSYGKSYFLPKGTV